MASHFTSAKNNNEGALALDQDELQLVSKIQASTEQFIRGIDSEGSVKPVNTWCLELFALHVVSINFLFLEQ